MATMVAAPRSRIAPTARPMMPAVMPGRPAWTAPTTPARLSCRRTGTQSATSTPRASPGLRVTTASTWGAEPVGRTRHLGDVAAVHLVHQDEMVAGHPDRLRDGRAVRLDGGRVVADVTTEVEAGIRPGAPPRRPVGEAEVDGAPDPVRSMVERQWNTTTNLSTASGPASHRCAGRGPT